jgi:hypothetical protein
MLLYVTLPSGNPGGWLKCCVHGARPHRRNEVFMFPRNLNDYPGHNTPPDPTPHG